MVTVLVSPSFARDSRRAVTVLVSVASISNALQVGGGPLRRLAASNDATAFAIKLEGWRAAEINTAIDSSGKSALHHAAWRGHISNVAALLDAGADINAHSTGTHNYGKSPIFYAITRCRNEVVKLLLSRGARVKIVNNKGQSVLSLAHSHCDEATVAAIQEAEAKEAEAFVNFRESHSDGEVYGDLDPRFAESSLGRALCETDVVTPLSVNPTTAKSRIGRIKRRNAVQDAERKVATPSAEELREREAVAEKVKADKAAAVQSALHEALAPLRALLLKADDVVSGTNAHTGDGDAGRGDADGDAEVARSAQAVADAADGAVAALQSIQGSWLREAALYLVRDAAPDSAAALNMELLRAASELPPSAGGLAGVQGTQSAKRIGLLRARLLRLTASPLRQLGASLPSARSHTRAMPPTPTSLSRLLPKRQPDEQLPQLRVGRGMQLEWVSSVSGLAAVRTALEGARYVGIDTEWAYDPLLLAGRKAEKVGEDYVHVCRLATIQLAVERGGEGNGRGDGSNGSDGEGSADRRCVDGDDEAPDRPVNMYVLDAMPRADGSSPDDGEAREYHAALTELLLWLLGERTNSHGGRDSQSRGGQSEGGQSEGGQSEGGQSSDRKNESADERLTVSLEGTNAHTTLPAPQLVGFAFAADAELLARRLAESSDGTPLSKHAVAAIDSSTLSDALAARAHCTTGALTRHELRRRVIDVQPAALSFGIGRTGHMPSLRATCEAFLGLTMDKGEQRSDWSVRPLSPSQLEYAALDALACVRILERQQKLMANVGTDRSVDDAVASSTEEKP